jgi:hypothetical protein
MEQRELAALASIKNPSDRPRKQLLVINGASKMSLASKWTNAGAVSDDNVFQHPVCAIHSSARMLEDASMSTFDLQWYVDSRCTIVEGA